MKPALAAVVLSVSAAAAQAEDMFAVAPALWDRPRSARAVQQEPAVRQALELYLARPAARLVVHHGYGQSPLLQAEEFRMWLMALAIDGSRVTLRGDAKPGDSLTIEVVK